MLSTQPGNRSFLRNFDKFIRIICGKRKKINENPTAHYGRYGGRLFLITEIDGRRYLFDLMKPYALRFNLGDIVNKKADFALQPFDTVIVFSKWSFTRVPEVEILLFSIEFDLELVSKRIALELLPIVITVLLFIVLHECYHDFLHIE